jgi:hypothetical protein
LPRRRGRFWLFAPFVLLGLAAAGWSAAWVVIRERTTGAIDGWLASEAALGRQWACPNRTVGGFPFRIEVRCDSLSLQRPDSRLTLGPVTALAQVYRPRHIIAHLGGPFRASDGRTDVEGSWSLLQASVRLDEGLQRASVAIEGPAFRVTGAPPGDLALSAQRLETHLRPNPRRGDEGAYDWTLNVARLALPGLDTLIGGTEPADVDLQLTATQARDIRARPWADELERWREAGGRLEVSHAALAKGGRRIEGTGQFGLDDAHRPQGRAELAAAGIEGLLGSFIGPRAGATAALLGALTGRSINPAPPAGGGPGKSGLTPLPPLRIEDGRVHVGPLPIPGVRLGPLY